MKISKLELIALLSAAIFLAFTAGWFLRGSMTAPPLQIETEHVLMPPSGTPQPLPPTPSATAVITPTPSAAPATPGASVPAVTPGSSVSPQHTSLPPETGKININTADANTLQTLPGIGEKRAAAIIAYRTAHGPFRRPEDLTLVKGIGDGILAGLISQITTGEDYP